MSTLLSMVRVRRTSKTKQLPPSCLGSRLLRLKERNEIKRFHRQTRNMTDARLLRRAFAFLEGCKDLDRTVVLTGTERSHCG